MKFTIHTFTIVPVSLVLLGQPLFVFAANEFDFLLKDIDTIQNELNLYEQDAQDREEEAAFQEDRNLFPIQEEKEQGTSGEFVTVQSASGAIPLTDVSHTAWFARYVQDISQRRIISGYTDIDGNLTGSYGPADTVTIEQLAKIAVIAAGVDQSKCPEKPINELALESWSAGYISCAEHLGWSVYSDGTVDPTRPALRADVVATILQAFNREMVQATGKVFKDVSNTMPSRYAIETAAHDGIVSGYTDSSGNLTGFFGPFDTVNRAETAKIVSLALQTYGF